MAEVSHKEACPRCREQGRDKSGDNLVVYKDGGGAFCFSCDYTIKSGASSGSKNNKENKLSETKEVINKITEEQRIAVREVTEFVEYRGIREDTAKTFGVRYEVDEEGNVLKQYYPVTKDGELVGYKIRKHPKEFAALGYCGKEADLGGQFKFTSGGRDIIICAGEIDQLSAYQMLRDDMIERGKGHYEPPAVVTTLVGESAAHRQCQLNYNFLNKFKRILICMDNDAAGKQATEHLVKMLPKDKIFLMELDLKDPNEYLQKDRQKDFVRCFWNAEKWTPAGIMTSDKLYDAALEYAAQERLELPPFLAKLNKMLGGGCPRSYIMVAAAASSIGKTTLVNQMVADLVMKEEEKVGVLSLEATAGEYATNLLSYYTKTKFAMIESSAERVALLQDEKYKAAAKELFTDENGLPRFAICDDRGASLEEVQDKIYEMIKSLGLTVLVIDVTSDILQGLSLQEQEQHMTWQKKLIKETNIIIINILHIRKASGGEKAGSRGAEVTDESIMGSSTIYKSAGIIVGLVRDKMAEDEVERNTTHVRLLKNRACGLTGPAGELYYDHESHTLYDKDEFFGREFHA